MKPLLLTRRWQGFTLLVIFSIGAFGVLSWWQWSRAEERRADRIAIEVSVSDPKALESAAEVDEQIAFTPVTFEGTFQNEYSVLVRKRPLEGSNGLWVMTPFQTTDGSEVWLLRGWMPAAASATGVIEVPDAPGGVVSVIAAIRSPEGTEPVAGLPRGQIPGVDPKVLPNTGSPTASNFLHLMKTSAPEEDLLAVPLPSVDEGQNISYAVQWILFALVAAVGWFYFLRREAKEDRDSADALH
ncbi:MAG: SURF1 family protein [Candidatus Nanopelagicales bacterium]|nr:SURF1 family protein [Candidatus Nanopelagicales bacterium]